MPELRKKVNRRAPGTEPVLVECHGIGEDEPNWIYLDEAPLASYGVTIPGFVATNAAPAPGEFRPVYEGRLASGIEFNAAQNGAAVTVTYKGRGSILVARDLNRVAERFDDLAYYYYPRDQVATCTAPGDLDERPALEALLATIPSTGGTVYLPAGVTRIRSTWFVPAHVKIVFGNGARMLADGAAVVFRGPIEASPRQHIFETAGPEGRFLFESGIVPTLYAEWWGAVANGTKDCTQPLQQALACSVAYRTITVQLLGGTYRVTGTLTVGTAGSRTDGFRLQGQGIETTRIVYAGSNTATCLRLLNVYGHQIDGLSVTSTNGMKAGILIDADDSSSGGAGEWGAVEVGNATSGVQIGRALPAVNGLPNHSFRHLSIQSCTNGLHVVGANTDGVNVLHLATNGVKYPVRIESSRNVHVHGGTHSNPSGAAGFADMIYMYATGVLGGGSYSVRGVRLEEGMMIAWFGDELGTNHGTTANLLLDHVTDSTPRGGVTGPVKLLHWGCQGAITMQGCHFAAENGYLFFDSFNGARYASLEMVNCVFNHNDPDTAGKLIKGTATDPDAVVGGVRATIRGCLRVVAAGAPQGRLRDRVLKLTLANLHTGTETVVQDLGV